MRSKPLGTLFLLLTQVVGRSLPAAAASLSVAPEGPCLNAAALTASVEREIGTPLDAAAPLHFELSDRQRGLRYEARVDVIGEGGSNARSRVIQAVDCSTLLETVSVAMTLALTTADASKSPLPSDRSAAPEAAADAAPVVMHDAPAIETPAGGLAGESAWVPSVAAGMLVDVGTLPAVSLGAGLGVALDVGRLQFRAFGTLLFDREVELAAVSPDAAAALGFVGAGLLACTALFEQPGAQLVSRVCVGWELGRMTGEGRRVARPERGYMLWSAPLVQLGGRAALAGSPWGIDVSLGAESPLNRDDFTLGGDTVYRPPVWVGRAALAVDVAFE